jgi:CRP/FNR family transcriptional regulator, cyclic AMP receptor protein
MSEAVDPGVLKSLAFLAGATDDEVRQLLPAARIEEYPQDANLFREGDVLGHVFVVVTGTAALAISGRDRRPRRFQTVGPGELLGWSPLLGPGPMTAAARALTAVRVVVLDARAILDVCEQDPRFGYNFMRRTAATIAGRLSATRLQLLDVYGAEVPVAEEGGRP